MSTVAVVAVEGKIGKKWLGGRTLLSRALQKLEDLRELDQVIVLGCEDDPKLAAVRQDVVAAQDGFDPGQLILHLQESSKHPGICSKFGLPDIVRAVQDVPLAGGQLADCWVSLDLRFPFLGSETLQRVVADVQTAPVAVTVRSGPMLHCREGGCRVVLGSHVVNACSAVRRTWWEAQEWSQLVAGNPLEDERGGVSFGAECRAVLLSQAECVDVGHIEGWHIASAMSAYTW